MWDGGFLDGRWLNETCLVQGTQERLGQAERRQSCSMTLGICAPARPPQVHAWGKDSALMFAMPARQWGERVTTKFPERHIRLTRRGANHAFTELPCIASGTIERKAYRG